MLKYTPSQSKSNFQGGEGQNVTKKIKESKNQLDKKIVFGC